MIEKLAGDFVPGDLINTDQTFQGITNCLSGLYLVLAVEESKGHVFTVTFLKPSGRVFTHLSSCYFWNVVTRSEEIE